MVSTAAQFQAPYANEYNFQGDFWRLLAFGSITGGSVEFISEMPLPGNKPAAALGSGAGAGAADSQAKTKKAMKADFVIWSQEKKALAVVQLKKSSSNGPNSEGRIKTSQGNYTFEEYVIADHLDERVRRACRVVEGDFSTTLGVFIMAFANGTFQVHMQSYPVRPYLT